MLCTGCEERPWLILSRTSCEERNHQDYQRWHYSATDYWLCQFAYDLQTDNSSATPAAMTWLQLCRYAYSPTDRTIVLLSLRSTNFCWHRTATHSIIDSADMPAIYRPIDSSSSVFDLLSPLDASTVLLPEQTPAAPARSIITDTCCYTCSTTTDPCCLACS